MDQKRKKLTKVALMIAGLWGLLFLLRPGLLSGLVTPILFLFAWDATRENEPRYHSSNPRHSDINAVLKYPLVQDLLNRNFWKPGQPSIIWSVVFLLFSMLPGGLVGWFLAGDNLIFPDSLRSIVWWMIWMPFLLISMAGLMEILFLQSVALLVIMVPLALFVIPYGATILWGKFSWATIPIMTIPLVLPMYLLDLARVILMWKREASVEMGTPTA